MLSIYLPTLITNLSLDRPSRTFLGVVPIMPGAPGLATRFEPSFKFQSCAGIWDLPICPIHYCTISLAKVGIYIVHFLREIYECQNFFHLKKSLTRVRLEPIPRSLRPK